MDNGIDASLGLEVVLTALHRLRKSGILQAEVAHIPGIRGRCRCSIEFVGGKITSCTLEETNGKRQAIGLDVIVSANQKKGPFTWSFHPKAPQRPLPNSSQISPAMQDPYQQQPQKMLQQYSDAVSYNMVPTPLKRASDLYLPNNLSPNERVILGWIFSLVDGQRTVADITRMLPRLRFEDVRNGLLFLKQMGAITLIG